MGHGSWSRVVWWWAIALAAGAVLCGAGCGGRLEQAECTPGWRFCAAGGVCCPSGSVCGGDMTPVGTLCPLKDCCVPPDAAIPDGEPLAPPSYGVDPGETMMGSYVPSGGVSSGPLPPETRQ